jgi:sugar phosphate isomerase/epimerase
MKINRRAFCKTTAFALGAGTLTAADKVTCGLGIGTYGLQSLSLEAAIKLIAGTGYNALEITALPGTTGDPAVISSTEQRKKLRRIIEDSGLRLSALMAGIEPQKEDGAHREQLVALRQLIEFANELSPSAPPVIQTILGGKNWDESRDLFRDRIADWIQIAADQKGILSIKPHRSHAMSVPSEAKWLIEQLGSPDRLGMVYDYSHYAFHEPPLAIGETVAVALPYTNYVAVKDAVMDAGKVRFALAGEGGNWDHAEVIKALYAGGYRGDFCCEVSSQIWKGDPAYDATAATELCFRNMKAAFDRAGVTPG